jgi:hypothetical protein
LERRLTVILAADVAGYSKLVGEDETGTIAAPADLRGDLIFNQFVSEYQALSIHGCIYKRLTGVSGTGNLVGGFKGEALGIGPAISWIPDSAGWNSVLSASWIHDVHSGNRLPGDYASLSSVYSFRPRKWDRDRHVSRNGGGK